MRQNFMYTRFLGDAEWKIISSIVLKLYWVYICYFPFVQINRKHKDELNATLVEKRFESCTCKTLSATGIALTSISR